MKILLLISLSFFLLLATPKVIFASESIKFDQENFFLQTSGQKEVAETVVIKNQTEQPLTVNLSWEQYPQSQHSLDFASLSTKELDLQPFSVGAVEVSMTIPKTLQSGDYYANLVAKTGSETKKSAFTLRFLGTLTQNVALKSTLYNNGNLNLIFTNQGNITSPVEGKIVTTNFFGQVVYSQKITTFDIKASETMTKTFETSNLFPGPYQTKIELLTGEKKVNQSSVSSFWVNPMLFVVLILSSVIILALITVLLWRILHA